MKILDGVKAAGSAVGGCLTMVLVFAIQAFFFGLSTLVCLWFALWVLKQMGCLS